jgi:hypothetical protein
MSDTRVGLLLKNLPELQALKQHLANLSSLERLVANVLPGHFSASVHIASFKGGELVLTTDNGAVASKLRQIAPRILNLLRQQSSEVTGIDIQVQVRMYDKPLPRKQLSLGPVARSSVDALAQRLRVSPLREALERLARHGSGD